MSQTGFDFPQPLVERYRPRQISDFVGIPKAKQLCANLAKSPRDLSLIFCGPSGTGKTTLALALAEAIPAELVHIPAQECTLARVQTLRQSCQYYPLKPFKFRLVLIDEADQMTQGAQIALLSMLDTFRPEKTIFIFTCNSKDGLEPRFLSRCMPIDFSSYGMSSEVIELLQKVWDKEAPASAPKPNFARIVKEACNNVRASLMGLESELMFT